LDTSPETLMQDKMNDKSSKSSTNADTSKKSEVAVETGIFMSDSLNVQIDIITQIWTVNNKFLLCLRLTEYRQNLNENYYKPAADIIGI